MCEVLLGWISISNNCLYIMQRLKVPKLPAVGGFEVAHQSIQLYMLSAECGD